jgi:hypothetical protein
MERMLSEKPKVSKKRGVQPAKLPISRFTLKIYQSHFELVWSCWRRIFNPAGASDKKFTGRG